MGTNSKEENMRSEKFVQKLPPHLDKKLADLVKEIEGVRSVRIINLYNDNESDNDSDNYYNKDFDHDNEYNCENYETLVSSSSDVFYRWSLVVTQQHYKKV